MRHVLWLGMAAVTSACTAPEPTEPATAEAGVELTSLRLPTNFTVSRLVPPASIQFFGASHVSAGGIVGGTSFNLALLVSRGVTVTPKGVWTVLTGAPTFPSLLVETGISDMSDDGRVIGYVAPCVRAGCDLGQLPATFGLDGAATLIELPPSTNDGVGIALNARGTVVFSARCLSNFLPYGPTGLRCPADAPSGTFIRIGGTDDFITSPPVNDLNNRDEIATAGPAVWSPSGGYRMLELPRGFDAGQALSLNDAGEVAGYVTNQGGATTATFWKRNSRPVVFRAPDDEATRAIAISGDGVVLVTSSTANYLWAPPSPRIVTLPVPSTGFERAIGITSASVVIGSAGTKWEPQR